MNLEIILGIIQIILIATTPLVFAGIGELVTEKTGVLNLGVEGMMLIGAVTAFVTLVITGSYFLAFLVSILSGALMSGLFAYLVLILMSNQVATGLALTIFGIGLNREIDPSIQEIIQTLNNKNLPIISLDIPSGINPDDGRVMGQALNAEMTITFMFKKLCFFLGEGAKYSGFIKYSDLDVSHHNEFLDNCDLNIIDREYVFNFLQRRSLSSHKGDFGHIGIFGSGKGMHGASLLAGEAALRSGAGKVSIFMHSSHRELIDNPRSELIINFIDNILEVESIINNLDVLVLGPGLGKDKWASDIFDFIIKYPQPKVIDADGLVFVKAKNLKQDNWVLTPHPGEAAELLNTSSKNIQDNRQLSLKKISNKFGGVIILKGHNTMIGHDENPSNICLKGNPGMATAGSGDVLAGIVSAMIGQKLSLFDASSVAVEIHAKAGDLASKDGERGLLAGDIIDEIRGCVN